jgi:hypothetical protein
MFAPRILVAVLVIAAAAMCGCGVHDPYNDPRPAAPAADRPQAPAPGNSRPTATNDDGSIEYAATPLLSASEQQHVLTAAKQFAVGWSAFMYGHTRLAELAPITDDFRAALKRRPPRVTPAMHARHARVLDVRVTPQTARSALATATIDDGSNLNFPIVFSLRLGTNGWVVGGLADD